MQNTCDTLIFPLTNTYATDILNPPTLAGGDGVRFLYTYILIKRWRVINTTNSDATYRIFRGLTTGTLAGTEIAYDFKVPQNDAVWDYPPNLRLEVVDFLTGGASVSSGINIQIEYEIGVI